MLPSNARTNPPWVGGGLSLVLQLQACRLQRHPHAPPGSSCKCAPARPPRARRTASVNWLAHDAAAHVTPLPVPGLFSSIFFSSSPHLRSFPALQAQLNHQQWPPTAWCNSNVTLVFGPRELRPHGWQREGVASHHHTRDAVLPTMARVLV